MDASQPRGLDAAVVSALEDVDRMGAKRFEHIRAQPILEVAEPEAQSKPR
jgi:hypothetical protein